MPWLHPELAHQSALYPSFLNHIAAEKFQHIIHDHLLLLERERCVLMTLLANPNNLSTEILFK
eukprot:1907340-Ditylum_brightwellii.AAC.1